MNEIVEVGKNMSSMCVFYSFQSVIIAEIGRYMYIIHMYGCMSLSREMIRSQKFKIKKNLENLEVFIECFTDKVKMQMRWGKRRKRNIDRIVEGKVKQVREGEG